MGSVCPRTRLKSKTGATSGQANQCRFQRSAVLGSKGLARSLHQIHPSRLMPPSQAAATICCSASEPMPPRRLTKCVG